MAVARSQISERKRNIALAIICGAFLVYGWSCSTNMHTDPGFVLGYNLVYALICWGLFLAIFGRSSRLNAAASFVVILASLVTASFLAAHRHNQEARKALSSIQEQLKHAEASIQLGAAPTPSRPQPEASASGPFSELELLAIESINESLAERKDYLLELQAIGWDTILSAERLRNDRTLAETEFMIRRARAIADKYKRRGREHQEKLRARMNSAALPDGLRKDAIAGFESGQARGKKSLEQQWRLEEDVVDRFDSIRRLLLTADWHVAQGQIWFVRDEDLERFNTLIREIHLIGEQQEKMQKEQLARLSRELDED